MSFFKRKLTHTNSSTTTTTIITEKQQEEEFIYPEEDNSTNRERKEKIINGSREDTFACFCDFVWRKNAEIGPSSWVEVLPGISAPPGMLEKGMKRKILSYEETIINVVKGREIVYQVSEGLPASTNKGRITFRDVDNHQNQCLVVWQLYWSPNSVLSSIVYKTMIFGYFELILYRLDGKVNGKILEDVPLTNTGEEDESEIMKTNDTHNNNNDKPEDNTKTTWETTTPPPQRTGFEGNLTPQQIQGLNELKKMIQHNPDCQYRNEILSHPDKDRWILRFLRATMKDKKKERIFQPIDAYKRLITTHAFRKEHGLDDITMKLVAGIPCAPPKWEEYKQVRPHYVFTGLDGSPISVENMGLFASHVEVDYFTQDEWIKFITYQSECTLQMMRTASKQLGREVSQCNVVIDEKGVSTGLLARMKLFGMFNDIMANHFCEFLNKIVIVRAPWIFFKIYAAVKRFLDADTQSKIIVDASVPLNKLALIMDVKKLPKEFGGENENLAIPLHARSGSR
jgi:hypothetical protein